MNPILENLFIFEMANNHMGDVEHGLRIIREIAQVCRDFPFKFGFKLQYRHLETFIHPDFQRRVDIKYIKRFVETRLPEKDFLRLRDEMKNLNFLTVCTPFDEESVSLLEKHQYDILKIGSCSCTDWPLLERIVLVEKPIIASTAGITGFDIDRVVSFLEHRKKNFAIMHCVGEYPTPASHLQLNTLDIFRQKYSPIPIGFSTHEAPETLDAVKIAIAKGATIFEKHVGIQTDIFPLNQYSAQPREIFQWLKAAQEAFEMCGALEAPHKVSEKEKQDLRGLQRGVYAREALKKGERLVPGNFFLAIPNVPEQLVANDLSKYTEFILTEDLPSGAPILKTGVTERNLRERIVQIISRIREILLKSHLKLGNKLEMELSHHYGIDRFEEFGASIIQIINREYCKKLLILLPGQKHPHHFHEKKEETFHILHGVLELELQGVAKEYKAGEMVIIERGKNHGFSSKTGAIIEEISTTQIPHDSFYEDKKIMENDTRKTGITLWSDWLTNSFSETPGIE